MAYRAFWPDWRMEFLFAYPWWQHALWRQNLAFGKYGYTNTFDSNGAEFDADCSGVEKDPGPYQYRWLPVHYFED